MIVTGTFDPVSQKDLEYLKQYRKENNVKDLFVSVSREGILDRYQRQKLLEKALRPYRHLHVCTQEGEPVPAFDEDRIRQGNFRFAADGIQKQLIEDNCYLDQIVDHMCKPNRAAHSRRVAEVCVHLAKVHHLDEKKAYRMGMLHDITKKMSDEEGEKILRIHDPERLSISPKVWHSFTAVYWLKENMGLYDPVVLNAIYYHTLGDGKGAYDHILYIADKIEPGRGYDTTRQMKAAEADLASAAAMILEQSKAYILAKEGIHV
ncbi:MAG: HD domain-containing protein [Erysipelotrichaceae bacterium]|nr:HD domain-containing protein [Erysipelotrichaceae bacterium]